MLETKNLGQEILREHQLIRDALSELGGELERLEAEPGPVHHPGKLLGMLAMFRHHLRRHFELEEEGGFLVDRAEMNPGTRRVIHDLLEEHRVLRKRIGSLIQGLERVECGSACLPDAFVNELKKFIGDLHSHERTENELVQEMFYRDVGAGD